MERTTRIKLMTRYMETRCHEKYKEYKEYKRLRNKAKHQTKKAIRNYEQKIALTAKEDPKTFWSVFTKEPKDAPIPDAREQEFREKLTTVVFTEAKVEKKLKKLKSGKSPGPDYMHTRILKETASQISKPLCMLFDSSLSIGVLPLAWKSAHVTALFKGWKNWLKMDFESLFDAPKSSYIAPSEM
ncbi:hypothetical protein CAPTEDRAFT_207630 [Capitella teleta]|uniref:Reverse transcriptase domain-containing protein n=1 Tax=Capitella teleta TaxID=283909 RepID=R7TKY1_CAPTE|nr:hypothetical protein CAPTEDRAFT_207630 [Capitella teleta]|eukprot:ELT94488.1 hypothetical protein CAPTEDRAFT_207630 [Capitella teleta]